MSPRFLVDLVHEARGPQARGLSALNQLETKGLDPIQRQL